MTSTEPLTSQAPPPPVSQAQYVWAVVILVLIGAVMAMVLVALRPEVDPLDVVTRVGTMLVPTIAGVLAYLKSQETHLSVNSRLDAFMREHAARARAEGQVEGAHEALAAARHIDDRVAAALALPEGSTVEDLNNVTRQGGKN